MGWCRSGTTVLANILNEIPGIVHVGELQYLWKNGVLRTGSNTLCGCGADLLACSLWRQVLEAECPSGKTLEDHAADILGWQQRHFRTRYTWRLLRADKELADPATTGYLRTLAVTYQVIGEVTGARIIVDTSKFPSAAAALCRLDTVRPSFVHMVRDPRASAFSWSRPKDYIPTFGPLYSTGCWVVFNLASEAVRRRCGRTLRLRYEDFVQTPRDHMDAILRLIGEDPEQNPVSEDGSVLLGGNHTVTGNPDRFQTGRVWLRPDARWEREMPLRDRLLATACASPLLARYGYRVRRSW